MRKPNIFVYMFLGFLDSGKTEFLQEALEKEGFENKKTLLLLCEEGEVEYRQENFSLKNVIIEAVEEEQLTADYLKKLAEQHKPEQVIVEYNGMWLLDKFYEAMPDKWVVVDVVSLFDSNSIMIYNDNMRNLVFDKIKDVEMVIFNRFNPADDKLPYHKLIRNIRPKCEIYYELLDRTLEMDDIPDPLPYDINEEHIKIRDVDYAVWYRDIDQETKKYIGKTITVKARVLKDGGLPKGALIFGRHIMTCCVEDIQFGGLVAKWKGDTDTITNGDWMMLTGTISIEFHETYGESGPILNIAEIKKAAPPVEEVATFG